MSHGARLRRRLVCAPLVAATLVLDTACLDTIDADDAPAIPDEVAWVGFVPEVPGATGSALRPYRADEPLVYPVDTGRTWRAVGYPAALLETFEVDAAIVRTAPLEWTEPDACRQLPAPLWEARATPGPSPLGRAAVRTDWSGTCAQAPSWLPGGVDVRCPALPGCGATFSRDACTLTFDADTCGGRTLVAQVAREGPACLERMDGCVRVPDASPEAARWSCGDCEIEAYPATPPRPLVARARRLITVTPTQAPIGEQVPGVQLRALEQGGVVSLALREREVWLAVRRDDRVSRRMCGEDESPYNDGLIVRLDQESLAEVGTRSDTVVPGRCITRLVADPLGPGVLATYYVDDVLHLGRYDAAGRPVDQRPLVRVTPTGEGVTRAVAQVVTSSQTTVVVEYFERTGEAVDDGMIYVVDTATLELRRALFRDGPVRGVAWAPGRDAVVVVVANALQRLTVPGLEPLPTVALPVLALPVYPHVLDDGRVLVSDPRLAQGLVEADRADRVRGVSRLSTYRSVITDLLVLPGQREGLAMVLSTPDEGRTSYGGLARVSLDAARGVRVAPQLWEVKLESGEALRSVLGQPTLDARGRLWAVAPWTGHVLRFDTLPAP